MGLTGAVPATASRETPPRFRRARGADAATLLVVFVILLIGIPTDLVLKALAAHAPPAMLLGPVLLLWWACARLLPGSGIARGRNPVRIAIGLLSLSVLAAYAAGSLAHVSGVEQRGADRGILYFVALAGTALLAM